MNKFTVEFTMRGAAFADGCAAIEAARILRDIAQKTEDWRDAGMICDINGNTVGMWSADFPEEEEV